MSEAADVATVDLSCLHIDGEKTGVLHTGHLCGFTIHGHKAVVRAGHVCIHCSVSALL